MPHAEATGLDLGDIGASLLMSMTQQADREVVATNRLRLAAKFLRDLMKGPFISGSGRLIYFCRQESRFRLRLPREWTTNVAKPNKAMDGVNVV